MGESNMGKTIAIIPARSHSGDSIRDDNFLDFIGRPIITYAIEEAKKSKLFDTIHVSTDSNDVSKLAIGMGVHSEFLRPKHLSDDSTQILTVVEWVLEKFGEKNESFDDIFIILSRFPLLCAKDLKDAYDLYIKRKRKFGLMTVSESPSRFEKYFRIKNDILIPIDNSCNGILNKNIESSYYNVGIFSIFPNIPLKDKCALKNIAFKVPFWKSIEINTDEDLGFSEILYKALHG